MFRRLTLLFIGCALCLGLFALRGVAAADNGWYGEYYDNYWFAGTPAVTRIDPAINFDWGAGSPDSRIPNDNFSVRWRRTFWADSPATYRFTVRADDTLKVWVNGTLQINITEATDITKYDPQFDIEFRQGNNDVYVEYKEDTFPARVSLHVERLSSQPVPEIHYFATSHTTANHYETVTVSWLVLNAAHVRIFADNGLDFDNLPQQGELTFNTGDICRSGNHAITLYAESADRRHLSTNYLPLALPDAGHFFFDQPSAQNPCTAPLTTRAVEQSFEGGTMVWIAGTKDIFAMYHDANDTPRFERFDDSFVDGLDAEDDPALRPPAGKQQPRRGFGKVWRENPHLREQLGWAISAEIPYSSTYQWSREFVGTDHTPSGPVSHLTDRFYFVSRDHQLWRLTTRLGGDVGTTYWSKTAFSYAD